jgi:hypothetical protein
VVSKDDEIQQQICVAVMVASEFGAVCLAHCFV